LNFDQTKLQVISRGNNTPFLNGSRPVFSFTSRLINHRKGEKRREKERVREKRERKWGLTGSCGLYPIFALPTTNNLSYHPTLVLAQKSRPSSTVPEHGPVLRKGEKRRERERVREKRERKWGLTGSCGLYPIFAKDPSFERARRGEKERE